jgi:hypothetical protein
VKSNDALRTTKPAPTPTPSRDAPALTQTREPASLHESKDVGATALLDAQPLFTGDATRKAQKKTVALEAVVHEKTGPAIDGGVAKNLWRELGGRSLLDAAANAQHVANLEKAASIIGVIEKLPGRLGSITGFRPQDAFHLYEHCFPNPDEQEPVSDIKARLKTYDKGAEDDGANFHAHVFTDKGGDVIAYSQGSTVPSEQGLFYFWQYGCVADADYMKSAYGKDSNPRQHGVMNTIHAVNGATLLTAAEQHGKPALGMMWESEPRGLGEDRASIQFTDKRLSIHNRAGGRVMMGKTADGELVNLHLQPRLTADSEPIALHVMFRPLAYEEGDEAKAGSLDKKAAEAMMAAWVGNFEREGFDKKDVKEAADEIAHRFARCESVVLLPADQVPDVVTLAKTDPILEKQVLEMYGVKDLTQARDFFENAMH